MKFPILYSSTNDKIQSEPINNSEIITQLITCNEMAIRHPPHPLQGGAELEPYRSKAAEKQEAKDEHSLTVTSRKI